MLLRDHVTKVDADTELDPLLRRDLGISLGHPPLHLDRTPHRVHHAGEFRQEAVAGVLYDPASMLRDLRIDQLSEVSFEPLVRALLIRAHKPRVTRHIGGQDRRELSFDGWGFQPGHLPNPEYIPISCEIRGVLSHSEARWCANSDSGGVFTVSTRSHVQARPQSSQRR